MKISKHEFLSKQNNIKLSECPRGVQKLIAGRQLAQKMRGMGYKGHYESM